MVSIAPKITKIDHVNEISAQNMKKFAGNPPEPGVLPFFIMDTVSFASSKDKTAETQHQTPEYSNLTLLQFINI